MPVVKTFDEKGSATTTPKVESTTKTRAPAS
jgi:hypothetical protein